MNAVGWIILFFLVMDLLLHFISDALNLKRLSPEVPAKFKGIYEAEKYHKSQSYLKANTKFGWAAALFDFALILCFWFGKGFFFLDQYVRHLELGPVLSGLAYMGFLITAKALLSLPFNIIDTFVIEEKYGFNQTTWRTFFADILKVAGLAVLIGGPVLAGILYFFEFAAENAWWYCWICLTGFVLLIQFVAPNWIMPLFNTYTPLEEGALKSAIMDYAAAIHFPLDNVHVMDGSKRSGKANAFFTGFGRNKKIVLYDTLVKQHDKKELLAVLAHEMGHYKLKHIYKMIGTSILQMGIMLYIMSWFLTFPPLFETFFISKPSVHAGLVFFGMLYAPIDFLVGILFQMVSRRHEYQADRFAAETLGTGSDLVSALKKLTVNNLANLTPHPLNVFLNYSHPPVLERIERLEKMG